MITREYFEWMFKIVDGTGYRKLLEALYTEEFYSILPLDDNRLVDGCELQARFAYENSVVGDDLHDLITVDRCSVLEVMIGLAIRIEETIMDDADYGNRTAMWFWVMVKSLGLYGMKDDKFDSIKVMTTLDTFLTRQYSPDGHGGLFAVKDADKDLREIDIWYQMSMFFDKLL